MTTEPLKPGHGLGEGAIRVTPQSPQRGHRADRVIYDEAQPVPKLFPQIEKASQIVVTYVQQAGGPPSIPPGTPGYLAKILNDQVYPMLLVEFVLDGRWHTTLIDLSQIRKRGLPDDYDELKKMFPLIRWTRS